MNKENISNNANFDNDEISIKELITKIRELYQLIISMWKLILLVSAIGGIIGFTYASFQKPIYKASLTFALEEDKGGSGGVSALGGLASQFGFDIGANAGGAFAGSNLNELIKSRLLVEKALLSPIEINGKIISLVEYYFQLNNFRKAWNKDSNFRKIQFSPNADRDNFSLAQDSILKIIYISLTNPAALTISQKEKKASITTIEVVSEDEHFAKIFCEKLVKVTSDYYIEIKSKKARLNVDILQKQADSIRNELNNAINGVAAASDNVYNLNPAFNIKKTPSTRRQVDVQANTVMLSSLVTNLELSKMTLLKETPLIQIIDRPLLPLDKEKVSKKKSLFLGGIIAGFLAVLYVLLIEFYKKVIA